MMVTADTPAAPGLEPSFLCSHNLNEALRSAGLLVTRSRIRRVPEKVGRKKQKRGPDIK